MSTFEYSVGIPVVGAVLVADIVVPLPARGVVVFVHGNGSSRRSPRNRYVADTLQKTGFATVLVDLLTSDDERIDPRTGELGFNRDLVAVRVTALTDWVVKHRSTSGLDVGLFGASTGAAAALVAAAARPTLVRAVVSRGGDPNLAGEFVRLVDQPTLHIVGELDRSVIDQTRRAMGRLAGKTNLEIVPGATHLFEEPGALDQVARLALDWFVREM